MISVRVHGEAELARVARRLEQGQPMLQRRLLSGVRAAAEPIDRELRAAIRGADVAGRRTAARKRFTGRVVSRGLRAPIARAVQTNISVRGGGPRAEIKIDESRVSARIRPVVKYVVGYATRWRHPIMGRTSRWAGQNAPNVWKQVVPRRLGQFNREIGRAVDDVARRLEG